MLASFVREKNSSAVNALDANVDKGGEFPRSLARKVECDGEHDECASSRRRARGSSDVGDASDVIASANAGARVGDERASRARSFARRARSMTAEDATGARRSEVIGD